MKDGISSTLEKTFVSVGYTPHLKLRTLLECFKHFTTNSTYVCVLFFFIKIETYIYFLYVCIFHDVVSGISELCCNKFVKMGIVHLLMRIFERWERFDGQMRLKICNHALNTLQHFCATSRFANKKKLRTKKIPES